MTRAVLLLLCFFFIYASSYPTVVQQGLPGMPSVRAWKNAMPRPLFELMESDARAVNIYESQGPSLLNNKRRTRWFPDGQYPRTALEEVMIRLKSFVKPGPHFKGFEWWVQVIKPGEPLGFHVDKDESVASNKHYLVHPIWSSVFYVTDVGGGTLIPDQWSPAGSGYEPEQPSKGWWVFPEQNKFMTFNGSLLHGVIPGKPNGRETERITFLVNFWAEKPEAPNCELIDHEDVAGLKVYSKAEMRALRQRINEWSKSEQGQTHKRSQDKLQTINLSEKHTRSYSYTIRLPGSSTEQVLLPHDVEPGASYELIWSNNNAEEEEEDEEEEEEEEYITPPKRTKKSKSQSASANKKKSTATNTNTNKKAKKATEKPAKTKTTTKTTTKAETKLKPSSRSRRAQRAKPKTEL